jgi:ATP-binding cassette subfamily B protein
LYDPTKGKSCSTGLTCAYDLPDLRQRIGVIFQVLSLPSFGGGECGLWPDRSGGRPPSHRAGGEKRRASRHLTLPKATRRRWDAGFQGRDLSGGEWQKIALGRAFMRACQMLVLDEPTAALDAENELRVFQQFRELTADKMAVLISHRFSTVRMADRIFVIEQGSITEQGTHQELLARGGTYARLFTLQAESYK